MLKLIAIVVGVTALAVVLLGVIFIVGMRAKLRPVLNAVRWVNRKFFNPRQMRSAGTSGAYASIIKHQGRTSGKPYETPVQAVPTEDGFAISLPYGAHSDWLKNVVALGSATLVTEGDTFAVDQPRIIPSAEAAAHFSAKDQRAHRMFDVDETLLLRRIDSEDP